MTDYPIVVKSKVFGVCAWIAQYFSVDVSIIRLVFVLTTIFGVGSPILIYLALAFIKRFIA